MADSPYYGMRVDFASTEYRQNVRNGIGFLNPNGDALLFQILSSIARESLIGTEYNWHDQILENRAAAVTGVYTDQALSSAYVTDAGVAGQVLFVKMAELDAKHFVVDCQVALRIGESIFNDLMAYVTGITLNGANSFVAVKLLTDDTTASGTYNRLQVTSSFSVRGGSSPDALLYDPTPYSNICGITKNSVDIDGTQKAVSQRGGLVTGDRYTQSHVNGLRMHNNLIENGIIFSKKKIETGVGGRLKPSPMGILEWIKTYAPQNLLDFSTDPTWAGQTWDQYGDEAFSTLARKIAKYGDTNSLVLAGDGVLQSMDTIAKTFGNFQIGEFNNDTFGLRLRNWQTSNGSFPIKTYPLFTHESSLNNFMLVTRPAYLEFLTLRDTQLYEDVIDDFDGQRDLWLTEWTLGLHYPITFFAVQNIGKTNTAA